MDQGIASFGYSILSIEKNCVDLLEYGCFKSKSSGNQQKRIFDLINNIEQLVDIYKPECMVHERLFFSPPAKNSRKKSASILNTNMITGAIWYISGKYNIPIVQFSPQTVKKTLCGNGRAEKEDVINYINNKYSVLCSSCKAEHICDAIAIGLTFVEKINNNEIFNFNEDDIVEEE